MVPGERGAYGASHAPIASIQGGAEIIIRPDNGGGLFVYKFSDESTTAYDRTRHETALGGDIVQKMTDVNQALAGNDPAHGVHWQTLELARQQNWSYREIYEQYEHLVHQPYRTVDFPDKLNSLGAWLAGRTTPIAGQGVILDTKAMTELVVGKL